MKMLLRESKLETEYYNKWMDGNQIAMPAPILDVSVDYDDGTDNNSSTI